MVKNEFDILFARIDDICRRAERGELGVSCFLSPREQHFIGAHLADSGFSGRSFAYGGYEGAERRRIYILPDYIGEVSSYEKIEPFEEKRAIRAVSVRGSGYKKLTHRDYLGSLLALGIEREVLGDIVFTDAERQQAIIFCDSLIAEFIIGELKRVGNDAVRVSYADVGGDFVPLREFAHISDTVASPRIDCIVAALCSLSRDKASSAVSSGLVEVNFELEERPDRTVVAPCTVSVRGYGKFRINSVSELTRRGRLRLDADKYV